MTSSCLLLNILCEFPSHDPRGKQETVKKHIASNQTANIFYLKNKAPDRWNDKQQIDHNINQLEKFLDGLEKLT